jgi:hypothetical protein
MIGATSRIMVRPVRVVAGGLEVLPVGGKVDLHRVKVIFPDQNSIRSFDRGRMKLQLLNRSRKLRLYLSISYNILLRPVAFLSMWDFKNEPLSWPWPGF